MSKIVHCPSCGEEIEASSHLTRKVRIDYYQSFAMNYNNFECVVCGYTGSLDGSDEKQLKELREKSDHETLVKLIDEITFNYDKAANIERAFSLPPRTLNRWKHNKGSASALALMKLIRTFSWLIKVAEHGYEPEYAKQEKYIQTATSLYGDSLLSGLPRYSLEAVFSDGSISSNVSLSAERINNDDVTIEFYDARLKA